MAKGRKILNYTFLHMFRNSPPYRSMNTLTEYNKSVSEYEIYHRNDKLRRTFAHVCCLSYKHCAYETMFQI